MILIAIACGLLAAFGAGVLVGDSLKEEPGDRGRALAELRRIHDNGDRHD